MALGKLHKCKNAGNKPILLHPVSSYIIEKMWKDKSKLLQEKKIVRPIQFL